jgi:hypothetical protein
MEVGLKRATNLRAFKFRDEDCCNLTNGYRTLISRGAHVRLGVLNDFITTGAGQVTIVVCQQFQEEDLWLILSGFETLCHQLLTD